jgi:hypothetical protein
MEIMKLHQKINQFFWQVFSAFLIPILILIQLGCPEPPETTGCGTHQIEVNGDCECEEGYHWSENETKCLMDTTSHNFVWDIDTLGGNGSYLNDVWIVDENDIWVVGNIETDSGEYNAAHWNGEEWEFLGFGSNTLDLNSIQYFSDDDIWICSGIIRHWNGEEWTRYHLWDMGVLDPNDGGVTEMGGASSSNIYFIGNKGTIVHFNGSDFTKMDSGTEISLIDIYGIEDNIYIVGYNVDNNGHSIALVNETGIWETDYYSESLFPTNLDLGILGRMYSTFSFIDTTYIIGKSGIMKLSISDKSETIVPSNLAFVDGRVPVRIRGNNYNDIMWVDIWGEIVHFNGVSWKLFQNVYNSYPNGQMRIRSMEYKNGICIGVGSLFTPQEKALIIIGKQIDY